MGLSEIPTLADEACCISVMWFIYVHVCLILPMNTHGLSTHTLAHAYTPVWLVCSTVTQWLTPRDSSQRSMSQLAREQLSGAHSISQAFSALVWRGMTSHRHHQGQVSALWHTFNTEYKCSCLGNKLSPYKCSIALALDRCYFVYWKDLNVKQSNHWGEVA